MLYLIRRLSAAALVIFGSLTMVFLVLFWLPGDPAAMVAGETATDEMIAHVRTRLGTDKPLWEQYVVYLEKLSQGDLGTSFSTNTPVLSQLKAQMLPTMALTFAACSIAIVLGIMLGILSAVHKDKWIDQATQVMTLLFTSMPTFWLGILLILIFSVTLRWLPAIGNGSIQQLILPVVCLGLIASGKLTRMVRNSVLDVLGEPFVTTLRGKGLLERQVLYRHVLRNALIPVVTLLGILVGELLSGSVVIETLFARQGLGRMLVQAVGVKDVPVVQGVILFAAVFYVVINALVDISYSWIDRRIRL